MGSDLASSMCSKDILGPCKTCVESSDTWCSYNKWDSLCQDACYGSTSYANPGCSTEGSESSVSGDFPISGASVSGDLPISGSDLPISETSSCSADSPGPCKTCVETQDTWCASYSWDSYCLATCSGSTAYANPGCASQCSGSLLQNE